MEKEIENVFDAFPHVKVKDPLSEVTRRERRSLLGISLVALFIVKVGLLPQEISTFGIKFAATDKGGLISMLILTISFYLFAFLIYALSDFITWRLAFIAELKKSLKDSHDPLIKDANYLENNFHVTTIERRWNIVSTPTSIIRALFEFIAPIAIALYSIFTLLKFNIQ